MGVGLEPQRLARSISNLQMVPVNVTCLFSSFQRYNLVSPITEQFDKSEAGIYETLFSKYIVLEYVVSMKLR